MFVEHISAIYYESQHSFDVYCGKKFFFMLQKKIINGMIAQWFWKNGKFWPAKR
jgi:hypothetical protein